MGNLHSFSIKNIFYDKMDLRLFYFDVAISFLLNSRRLMKILQLQNCNPRKIILIHDFLELTLQNMRKMQCDQNLYKLRETMVFQNYKHYEQLPKFRPIIDTTSTPYYDILKFLSDFPNPFTENQYVVKNSFSAVEKNSEYWKKIIW